VKKLEAKAAIGMQVNSTASLVILFRLANASSRAALPFIENPSMKIVHNWRTEAVPGLEIDVPLARFAKPTTRLPATGRAITCIWW
jgi:hypothetical protein